MKEKKLHIILKLLSVILVFAIITPTLVKFSHGFQDHEHEVCYGESSSHLHEIDIDCEFYKFKLNTQYVDKFKKVEVLTLDNISDEINSQYNFISDYQKLQFSLRGPPHFV